MEPWEWPRLAQMSVQVALGCSFGAWGGFVGLLEEAAVIRRRSGFTVNLSCQSNLIS